MKAKNQETKPKTLKILEICRIIKTCRANGVESFAFGELSLKFAVSSQSNVEPQLENDLAGPPTNTTQVDSPPQSRVAVETSMFTPQDKELMQDLERSQLLIDDPEGFEEQMIAEDLENGRVEQANAEI